MILFSVYDIIAMGRTPYLKRFQDIFANDSVDFTKPNHKLNESVLGNYTKSSKTRMSKFNLIYNKII